MLTTTTHTPSQYCFGPKYSISSYYGACVLWCLCVSNQVKMQTVEQYLLLFLLILKNTRRIEIIDYCRPVESLKNVSLPPQRARLTAWVLYLCDIQHLLLSKIFLTIQDMIRQTMTTFLRFTANRNVLVLITHLYTIFISGTTFLMGHCIWKATY